MKNLFRASVLVLLVGGWSLAASAIHVVRTPSNIAVVPKDRLSFHDTWVDTRKWQLADDQAHGEIVARLVHLGRADLLRHTLSDVPAAAADVTLATIAAAQPTPGVVTSTTANNAMENASGGVKSVVTLAKEKVGKL